MILFLKQGFYSHIADFLHNFTEVPFVGIVSLRVKGFFIDW